MVLKGSRWGFENGRYRRFDIVIGSVLVHWNIVDHLDYKSFSTVDGHIQDHSFYSVEIETYSDKKFEPFSQILIFRR
jgi:hypothetical protein